MRDKFIHDIAGDKIDVVQDAMSFYISLKAKDNSVIVLEKVCAIILSRNEILHLMNYYIYQQECYDH